RDAPRIAVAVGDDLVTESHQFVPGGRNLVGRLLEGVNQIPDDRLQVALEEDPVEVSFIRAEIDERLDVVLAQPIDVEPLAEVHEGSLGGEGAHQARLGYLSDIGGVSAVDSG